MKATVKEEWTEIEFGVDSGASETVLSPEQLPGIDITEGEPQRRGVSYEIANGEFIPNLGEKKFIGYSEEEVARSLVTQVTEVNQALLSVRKMVASGHRVVFDADDTGGSYIEHKTTGERMAMKDDGKMYLLKLWVQNPGF